jgi:magnesium chelatase family protein
MSAKVLSAAVVGLDAKIVDVEADISRGLPKMFIVGLPDTAVSEAKERVRSGIKNSGVEFLPGIITVNLAPANLKKEGPSYDLPIALAILMVRGEVIIPDDIMNKLFIGELSLNGDLRPVNGILSVAMIAKQKKIKELYVPADNAAEATLVKGTAIFPVKSLTQLMAHINGQEKINPYKGRKKRQPPRQENQNDMSFVRGQEQAKRALEIAAAGAHNVLLTGPPGSGKTLLARTMSTILPVMDFEESLEVTKVYSVAGLLSKGTSVIQERPFRAPHHSTSSVALVGGGSFPKPGEISLAHRGVLFLDEFSEFSRAVLESLRQPLEDGVITVARAAGSVQFPARFTLIAARNPCACGFFNDQRQPCTCSPHQIIKYQKRISGPLLDRIDIHVTVPRLSFEKVAQGKFGELSSKIRARVEIARRIQVKRFKNSPVLVNAEMVVRNIDKFCQIEEKARELLKNAVNQFYLSARAYHRILKVGRTIADLDNKDLITAEHIAEALQYRPQAS